MKKQNDFLKQETSKLFDEVKISINNYLNQDLQHPIYFFHGSNKKLNIIECRQSHDADGIIENIDHAVFVIPSFLMATA